MTIELRKPGTVDVTAPLRTKAQVHFLTVRARVVTVSRRQAWTAWQIGRQLPATTLLLLAYTPRGIGRVTAAWARYLRDYDTVELRAHHAGTRETADYLRASQVRSANLTARLMVNGTIAGAVLAVVLAWTAPQALGVLAAVLVFVWVVKLIPGRGWGELAAAAALAVLTYVGVPKLAVYVPFPPAWAWWMTGVGGVVLFGWLGRPKEKPLVTLPEVTGGRVTPLTAPMVTEALCSLGNSKMREADTVKLLMDVARRGPGYQVDMEIPVPATWVMERREELATALRRELGTVWPSVGKRHPGHLSLYVADLPMNAARQAPWPLLRDGVVDLFAPQPFATDQMGSWVSITLAYCSGVIGAVPRMGKTFALRELLLIAGLDVRARVYGFDGKGTGDLSPCGLFAHYIGVGDEPEDIDEQLEVMRGLRAELRRRAKVIRSLPREECPESKVTSVLASRRDLGLEPIVVGVDETQTWFEYGERGNKEHKAIREEFNAICTDLAKRGPALGFILLLATQQVNANTIPTSISNNAVIRYCLKVFGHVANDQVLGTGARKEGIDATMFAQEDKGIGYLRADGADAQIVRTVVGLDAVAAEKVAARARSLREAAGRLSGQAAGVQDVAVADVAADALQVMVDRNRDKAQHVELVEWLQAYRRDYDGLDVEELSARLRAAGVQVVQVRSGDTNRRGVRADDLRERGVGDAG